LIYWKKDKVNNFNEKIKYYCSKENMCSFIAIEILKKTLGYFNEKNIDYDLSNSFYLYKNIGKVFYNHKIIIYDDYDVSNSLENNVTYGGRISDVKEISPACVWMFNYRKTYPLWVKLYNKISEWIKLGKYLSYACHTVIGFPVAHGNARITNAIQILL